MLTITARWGSLKGAVENARLLGAEVGNVEVLERALIDVGRPLRDEISRSAPRSQIPPHVAETFIIAPSKEARSSGKAIVFVGPSAKKGSVGFVATFLEYGTSRMAARPFIRPAWDAWKGSFTKGLTEQIRRHYERVVKKYVRKAGFNG